MPSGTQRLLPHAPHHKVQPHCKRGPTERQDVGTGEPHRGISARGPIVRTAAVGSASAAADNG
eukprot:8038889-Pyramimonas_sp.AAC.1